MVSRDAIDFVLGLKGITDRTGDALRPVQAWVVDEVAGRVRLRFGGETDEEAGTARYARNGGAPYAPGTEVMAQPVGREWFVLGPVQRGAGVATPSVEGTGALPGAPVPDLLAVIAPSIRWQGTVRTMTTKQRALALRMVRQFPGLLQVASGGRVGCRVRLVVQEETWDLDAAITAGRAEVTAFGTTGSWITDQGAQSLWATYGGLTYDTRMLFLGTSQMDSTVNELTRRDFPYSFINPEDTWYDSERAANRVTDTMVHAYMRQLEEILRDHGVDPTLVDGYAAAGYGVDPVKGLMPWFQEWWRTADLAGLVDDGRLPDVDARTSLVPFTRVDLDDAWGSLQGVVPTPTGSTEVLPRTTFGIVVPNAINLGSQWGGDQTIPVEQRTRMKSAAADLSARVRRVAGVAVDLTIVSPARFAATVTAATGAVNAFADPTAAEAEFTRVGAGTGATQARVVLAPYYGPGPSALTNGFMNFARKQGVTYDNNQFNQGAFGSWGATLCHEWLHSVEQRLRDAGYSVGYGLDCPLIHDGSTSTGQHRPQYPEDTIDRDEWRFLDDMMANKVPKPGGGLYGISPAMWAAIFPPVAVPIAPTTATGGGSVGGTVTVSSDPPIAYQTVLFVVTTGPVKYRGVTRFMTQKEEMVSRVFVDQFPGLMDVTTSGRLRVQVRVVYRTELLDIDAWLDNPANYKDNGANRDDLLSTGGTNHWMHPGVGERLLTNQYGGQNYDGRIVITSKSQVMDGAYARTNGTAGWSFLNPADSWYDDDRVNNRVSDLAVHEYGHQYQGKAMSWYGQTGIDVQDNAAAYGYSQQPYRAWMDWYIHLANQTNFAPFTTLGNGFAKDARTTPVSLPLTPYDIDNIWGTRTQAADGSALTLEALSNVSDTPAVTGQVLLRQADGTWAPGTVATGSGGSAAGLNDGTTVVASVAQINAHNGLQAVASSVAGRLDLRPVYGTTAGMVVEGNDPRLDRRRYFNDTPQTTTPSTSAANAYILGNELTFTLPAGTWTIVIRAEIEVSSVATTGSVFPRWSFNGIVQETRTSGLSPGVQVRRRTFYQERTGVTGGPHVVRTQFAASTTDVATWRDGAITVDATRTA